MILEFNILRMHSIIIDACLLIYLMIGTMISVIHVDSEDPLTAYMYHITTQLHFSYISLH